MLRSKSDDLDSSGELNRFQERTYFEQFYGKDKRRGNGSDGRLTTIELDLVREYAALGPPVLGERNPAAEELAQQLFKATAYTCDHFVEEEEDANDSPATRLRKRFTRGRTK